MRPGAPIAITTIGGLASVGFYWLVATPSLVPGIGASGAIAGLMGMYTVLYWTRPMRFFYFILVYFDYVRLPAIVLLPLWIGSQLVQMALDGDSQINYLAHLGGLLGGALIGWASAPSPQVFRWPGWSSRTNARPWSRAWPSAAPCVVR